ncbi:MAG: hypothetical protein WDN23_06000 [Edaphobacter sp.]
MAGSPGTGAGFIAEWERVVTPVVDYCEKLACVDASRIALLGSPLAAISRHALRSSSIV